MRELLTTVTTHLQVAAQEVEDEQIELEQVLVSRESAALCGVRARLKNLAVQFETRLRVQLTVQVGQLLFSCHVTHTRLTALRFLQ